jgi:hypothetical protein
LQSRSLFSAPLLPANPVATGELPVLSKNRAADEPDIGAVRMAVDLAAQKTGALVSKIGSSIKHVF